MLDNGMRYTNGEMCPVFLKCFNDPRALHILQSVLFGLSWKLVFHLYTKWRNIKLVMSHSKWPLVGHRPKNCLKSVILQQGISFPSPIKQTDYGWIITHHAPESVDYWLLMPLGYSLIWRRCGLLVLVELIFIILRPKKGKYINDFSFYNYMIGIVLLNEYPLYSR